MSKPILDKPIPLFSEDLIKELAKEIQLDFAIDDSIMLIGWKKGRYDLIQSLLIRLERQKTESVKGNITS